MSKIKSINITVFSVAGVKRYSIAVHYESRKVFYYTEFDKMPKTTKLFAENYKYKLHYIYHFGGCTPDDNTELFDDFNEYYNRYCSMRRCNERYAGKNRGPHYDIITAEGV